MKVLVCGGAGYIGSHTVFELIRNKFEVVILDDLSTGNRNAIHKDAIFYEGSILDYSILDEIFKEHNIDLVMNFAAKLIVSESINNPLDYYRTNVEGVRVLLEAMNDNNVKKIIFSSTAAVYGDPNNMVCDEETPTVPINPYGESKLEAERLIESAADKYDINYIIFRYFNVSGVSDELMQKLRKENPTHLIPVVIETALGVRDKIFVYGNDFNTSDGTCVRSYTHITDLVNAHMLGIEFILEKNVSHTFNLGSELEYSVLEVINEINKIKSVNYEITHRMPGEPGRVVPISMKAKEILGFKIKKTFQDIIESEFAYKKILILKTKKYSYL